MYTFNSKCIQTSKSEPLTNLTLASMCTQSLVLRFTLSCDFPHVFILQLFKNAKLCNEFDTTGTKASQAPTPGMGGNTRIAFLQPSRGGGSGSSSVAHRTPLSACRGPSYSPQCMSRLRGAFDTITMFALSLSAVLQCHLESLVLCTCSCTCSRLV